MVKDPLARALSHGHNPPRGAIIDAELQAEEERVLREKEKRKKKVAVIASRRLLENVALLQLMCIWVSTGEYNHEYFISSKPTS